MKAKLILNEKEYEIEIGEEEINKFLPLGKKTLGYERVNKNEKYYYIPASSDRVVTCAPELNSTVDDEYFRVANYYSDKNLAEFYARADALMRNLRRFSAINRDCIKKNDEYQYYIYYDNDTNEVYSDYQVSFYPCFGMIYFDSKENCEKAIKKYRKELIWYFEKYEEIYGIA